MIIDRLENADFYFSLGQKIKKAFEFLKNADLIQLELGKHQIENDDIYAMVFEYETKSAEGVLWEAHRKYIDIQYIVDGSEKMGYTNLNNIKTTVEYDSEKDILFGTSNGDFLKVKKGDFIIFTPQDGHITSISIDNPEKVKRIVVKVIVD